MQGTGNNHKNFIMLLLIILSSSLAIYTSLNINKLVGPTSLAAGSNGDVVVALWDRIVVLDAYGGLKQSITFEKAGLAGKVTDMQALSNGDFIVGSGGDRSLYRCDYTFFGCVPLGQSGEGNYRPGRFFKFYVDESQQHIILSNTERHELVLLDMQGGLMRKLFGTGDVLRFPDGVYPLTSDSVLLANALGKEILEIGFAQGSATILARHSIDRVIEGVDKSLPLDLAQTRNGDWWVAAQDASLSDDLSAVLVFDRNWLAKDVITADGMQNPVDMLNTGDHMLVADMSGFRIHVFDDSGRVIESHIDAELIEILEWQRELRTYNNVARLASIAIIVLLLVVALIMERKRKKTEDEVFERQYGESTDVLVEVPSAISTGFRVLPVFMIAMLIITGVLLSGSSPELFRVMMMLMVPMFLALSLFSYMFAARIPLSIEIRQGVMKVIASDKKSYESELADVQYSKAAVWIQDIYFLIGRQGAFLKSKKKYEKLMSLLSSAHQLKESKAQFRMMRRDKWLYIVLLMALLYTFFITSYFDSDEVKKEGEVVKDVLVSMKD